MKNNKHNVKLKILIGHDNPKKKLYYKDLKNKKNRKLIKIINHKKNLGEIKNLNYLLKECQTEWFCWLADDDIWHPFFLSSVLKAYKNLEKNGVPVAIATDYNPGSCSIQSMPFIISLACLFLKMDILEAVKACTYTSAKSLMLEDTIGSIEVGIKADLIIWEIDKIENVPYLVDSTPIRNVLKNGSEVFTA